VGNAWVGVVVDGAAGEFRSAVGPQISHRAVHAHQSRQVIYASGGANAAAYVNVEAERSQ
jgi:hypothetical protein